MKFYEIFILPNERETNTFFHCSEDTISGLLEGKLSTRGGGAGSLVAGDAVPVAVD